MWSVMSWLGMARGDSAAGSKETEKAEDTSPEEAAKAEAAAAAKTEWQRKVREFGGREKPKEKATQKGKEEAEAEAEEEPVAGVYGTEDQPRMRPGLWPLTMLPPDAAKAVTNDADDRRGEVESFRGRTGCPPPPRTSSAVSAVGGQAPLSDDGGKARTKACGSDAGHGGVVGVSEGSGGWLPTSSAAGGRKGGVEEGGVGRMVVKGQRMDEGEGGGGVGLVAHVVGGGGGMSKKLKREGGGGATRGEAREIFAGADRDQNQSLDRDELREALKKKGVEFGEQEFGELFAKMDTNGDGTIDFTEFERALAGLSDGSGSWRVEGAKEERLKQAFEAMDREKRGVVGEEERGQMRDELARVLLDFGMSPKRFDKVGGGLSYGDFRQQFVRELEVSRKEQGLLGAKLTQAVAECVPGGSEENPLGGLEGMSAEDLGKLCTESVLPAVQRALTKMQERLREATRRREEAAGKAREGGNNKFSLGEGTRMATFGELEDFHTGIMGKIGLPHARLKEGMKSEHCMRGDSNDSFSPGNYDTTTTPLAEWEVVTDESKGKAVSVKPRRVLWLRELMKTDTV